MKRLIQFCLITCAMLFFSQSILAQARYTAEVFTDVTVMRDIKYAENYSIISGSPVLEDLLMDVYMPVGDTVGNSYYEAERPLIILTHAGSFVPKNFLLPFGAKNDSALIEMCTQFAKRGWVAVSMNYRIGWSPLSSDPIVRKATIINAVYRAMQDLKACVRYFRADADNTDMYRIDPYRVAVGGSNSGGYVSLAVGNLNRPSELRLPKFLNPATGQSVIDTCLTGGFFGEGGTIGVNAPLNNPGYSSEVQVILNMGGAVGDTTWQNAGEPPVVSFHGELDPLTPYRTETVIVSATGDPVVEVSGSYDLTKRAVNLGNQDVFSNLNLNDPYTQVAQSRSPYEGLIGFPGAANGYEPWAWYDGTLSTIDNSTPGASGFGSKANPFATRAKAEAYIDTIMEYFTPRALAAFNQVDSAAVETPDPNAQPTATGCVTGIPQALVEANLFVYPNPAINSLTIQSYNNELALKRVTLYNLAGKELRTEDVADHQLHTIARNGLKSGFYVINIEMENGTSVFKRVMFE